MGNNSTRTRGLAIDDEIEEDVPAPIHLLADHPVFRDEVLSRLSPTDRAMLARVDKRCAAVVALSGLPRAGSSRELPFKVRDFVGSPERLIWGEANDAPCGCDEATMLFVAGVGSVETVRWMQERMCYPINEKLCASAAAHGNFQALRYTLEHGCPCGDYTFGSAAGGGQLAIMQFLRERQCPWTQVTCADAAGGGHLEALQWLIRSGCPWDRRVFECAALGGHTHVLSWAFAHSYSHNPNIRWRSSAVFAARGGHLETLQWLLERGIRLNAFDLYDIMHTDNIEMKTWVMEYLQEELGLLPSSLCHFVQSHRRMW